MKIQLWMTAAVLVRRLNERSRWNTNGAAWVSHASGLAASVALKKILGLLGTFGSFSNIGKGP
jgi:hypothetical protein